MQNSLLTRANIETKLSAVNEYLSKCIAKPETYADRKVRREAKINRLKEAVAVPENETAFTKNGTKQFMSVRKH